MMKTFKETFDIAISGGSNSRPPRHISATTLNDICPRQAFLRFYWIKPPQEYNDRIMRIFGMGKAIENMVISSLIQNSYKNIKLLKDGEINIKKEYRNVFFYSKEEDQWCFKTKTIKAYFDGFLNVQNFLDVDNGLYGLEIKTSKQKKFSVVANKKNLKKYNRSHYYQIQFYLYLLSLIKLNVKGFLYLLINKDNSETYLTIIEKDKDFINNVILKDAKSLISKNIPDKIPQIRCSRELSCDFYDYCYGASQMLMQNCRTCKHFQIRNNFFCNLNKKELTFDEQLISCQFYEAVKFNER